MNRCDEQASQPELYSIENFSPLPGGSTLPQIKDACVAVKRNVFQMRK